MNVRAHFTMRKQGYVEIIKPEMGARLTRGSFPGRKRQKCEQEYKIFVCLRTNSHHEDTILPVTQ